MTDARGTIEHFNRSWLAGDLAAVVDSLTDDVTYCPNAWDGPADTVHGRDEVAAVFAGQVGDGDGPVLGAVWAAGDRAVCEWQWPPAPDGTVLRGLDVYLIRAGRIARKDVFGKIVRP